MRNCKGCQENCWGKEYDPETQKWYCVENGEYIQGLNPKGYPQENDKERVIFT